MPKKRLLPFTLTALILVVDQITKHMVVRNLKIFEKSEVLGDFLWIWHTRNTGMLFSVGHTLPPGLRTVIFIALPALALALMLLYYFKSGEIREIQRWCFAAILGGGLGNLVDRIFRTENAVIDFISFKFYGLLGMERYPSFNAADSAIVCGSVALVLSILFTGIRSRK